MNFLTGRPAIIMSEDCGSMDKRRQLDFITGKKSVQPAWGENIKNVSNFLEDMNQPTPSLLPEKIDSFINENVINLLSIGQQRIKKTFDICGYENTEDICAITSSDKNHPTGRCTRNIFTDPELTLSNSNLNNTSYLENCRPNKNYPKEHNNERNNLSTCFEKNCYPLSSENRGWCYTWKT